MLQLSSAKMKCPFFAPFRKFSTKSISITGKNVRMPHISDDTHLLKKKGPTLDELLRGPFTAILFFCHALTVGYFGILKVYFPCIHITMRLILSNGGLLVFT